MRTRKPETERPKKELIMVLLDTLPESWTFMIYHESIAPKMFIAVHAQLSNSCFPKGGERSAHMTHQFFSLAAVSPLRIASMYRRRWSCFLTYTACSRIHTWSRIWPTGTDNTHAYLWTTQITGTPSISFPEPQSSEWWLWKRNYYPMCFQEEAFEVKGPRAHV